MASIANAQRQALCRHATATENGGKTHPMRWLATVRKTESISRARRARPVSDQYPVTRSGFSSQTCCCHVPGGAIMARAPYGVPQLVSGSFMPLGSQSSLGLSEDPVPDAHRRDRRNRHRERNQTIGLTRLQIRSVAYSFRVQAFLRRQP